MKEKVIKGPALVCATSRSTSHAESSHARTDATLEPRYVSGNLLLHWLVSTATERGTTLHGLADALGVTYGYLAQLLRGIRRVNAISPEFSAACAEYLGLPRIAVLIAAGVVKPTDFYADTPGLEERIDQAIHHIRNDKVTPLYLPLSIYKADPEIKLLVVNLVESASGKILLPDRADIEMILSDRTE